MVVPQRIPESIIPSPITATVAERLTTINDQIMSRSRLEQIITDYDLYKEARATGIMEDIVQRMRLDIKPSIDGKDAMTFRVAYVNSDPKTAQKVTERLASLYIEENLRDGEVLTESTNQFIESQLEDAKRRLVEHEKKLEEYRRLHAGQLPSQLQSNLQAIQNAQLQLQTVGESMNRARERHLLLERQLADAQTTLLPVAPSSTPEGPETAPTTAQQLEAAQARLDLFKLRYTPDHPDVKSLQRTIGELQAKLAEEAKRPPTTVATEKPLTPAEAARQKRIRDLQADIDVLDRQMTTTLEEESRLKKLMGDYQAKVDVLPSRESDLVELMRDYAGLQETYSSLLKKREDSKLAANLERRQIGEQFKVLDPASLAAAAVQREEAAHGTCRWRHCGPGVRSGAGRVPRISGFEFQERGRRPARPDAACARARAPDALGRGSPGDASEEAETRGGVCCGPRRPDVRRGCSLEAAVLTA